MVIPISLRQDSVGPVARTVKDAAYMLSAIAGKDKFDNWTSVQPEQTPDYVKACNYSGFKGARMGVPRNGIEYFLNNSTLSIMAAFEDALHIIRGGGGNIVDDANFASFDVSAFGRNSSIVLGTDFAAGLSDYLSKLQNNPNDVHDLYDIAQFTKNHPCEQYPDRDVSLLPCPLSSCSARLMLCRSMSGSESSAVTSPTSPKSLTQHIKPTFTWLKIRVWSEL